MATKKGPTKGSRVLVKLPFAGTKTGGGKPASNLIMVKAGVAKYFGWTPEKQTPKKSVSFKTASGTAKAERLSGGASRRRSITVYFDKEVTIAGSKGKYKSVAIPLPSGATIADAVNYFEKNDKGIVAIKTPHGKRYPIGAPTLN